MSQFLGEFYVKIDAKGRVRLPGKIIQQLGADAGQGFVINRGIEKCLNLYPKSVWDQLSAKVKQLNQYVKKNRDFIRYFYRGASEVNIDASDRILISKQLTEYIGASKEIVLFAVNDHIEIWSVEKYHETMDTEPEDFSALAEDVMGDQPPRVGSAKTDD